VRSGGELAAQNTAAALPRPTATSSDHRRRPPTPPGEHTRGPDIARVPPLCVSSMKTMNAAYRFDTPVIWAGPCLIRPDLPRSGPWFFFLCHFYSFDRSVNQLLGLIVKQIIICTKTYGSNFLHVL
jgi:hypothetical protein